MERTSFALAMSMLLAAAVPVAAQRNEAAEKVCFSTGGHADAKACLEQRSVLSAKAVAGAEAAFRKALAMADEEAEYRDRALAAFEAGARQYAQFRKAQCEVPAMLAFGGNAASDRRWLCQIELDTRRVADLTRETKSIACTH